MRTRARQLFAAVGMACVAAWGAAHAQDLKLEIGNLRSQISDFEEGSSTPIRTTGTQGDKQEKQIPRPDQAGTRNDSFVLDPALQREGAGRMPAVQEAQQEPLPVIKKEVQLVLVEATVKDRGGKVMKLLKKEDFQLYEDGQAQEIAHFSQDQLPLAVAMVVDLSTSIEPFLGPLRGATRASLTALKAEDEVALFTFASHADKRVDLTRDKQKVSEAIELFGTGGGSNINNALYEAAQYLRKKAPAARRVIVLVSDNMPSVSGAAPDEVLKETLKADAAVYSLKVPGRNPLGSRAKEMRRGLVNVKEITEETGGEILQIGPQGSLLQVFQTLIERLKGRYTLGFYPAHKTLDQKLKKLEVKLRPSFGVKGKDYTVASKSGYYAAGSR